jgi:hypothetical protein
MRERLALNVMYLIGVAFRDSNKSETIRSLARHMKMPSVTLTPIIAGLEAEKILTTTEAEELVPAREMSRLKIKDILAVVREHGETGSYRDPKWDVGLIRNIRCVRRNFVTNTKLRHYHRRS